ncbi:CYTH domain-containing protein [Ktedonobacteria bacterium brp13]|nr:CYTH domain-containing protein [Ktedonobacteria bacterium brp13]
MQEIELTCEATSAVYAQLEKKLVGLQPERVVVNEDHYYDTATVDLFKQAVFVRVRTTGKLSHLQFKFDEPESEKTHIACIERDFPLFAEACLTETAHTLFRRFLPQWHPSSTWKRACADNALQELVSIHNTRALYTRDSLTICLDQIEGLGTFIEVEQMCEEGIETQQAQNHIRQFIADLGGKPLTAGYVELALRRQRPDIYQQGQYHLL